jgi:hypothetical protein
MEHHLPGQQRSPAERTLWLMLSAFISAFALSNAFRTMPAITAAQIGS